MKNSIWPWVALLTLCFAALAAVFYFFGRGEPELPTTAGATVEHPAAQPPGAPTPRSTPLTPPPPPALASIPEPAPAEPAIPLPSLDESDEELLDTLTELLGASAIDRYLIPESLIRNFVVTVDNLPRRHVSERHRPVGPAPESFMVAGDDEELLLNPENYDRYVPMTQLFAAADTRLLVASYRRLYPLMREAYEELGHADGNFHRRLLEVIEDLLATPEPRGPIRLARPNVLYEYADERLESLSAGQKTLLRMGPDNAAIIKAKLRELRDQLL
jgi:hypothetical protein